MKFLKYWLPVCGWLALMFVGSTDLLSAAQTSRLIGPLLRWLNPDISPAAIAQLQFFVRKAAHLIEYGVLAALLWRALRGTAAALKMSILAGAALLTCAIFAASDEFHQSFVASRTASASDVLIDICGAMIGLTICVAVARRKTVKRKHG